jgi:pilus assembly protein CpaB
MNLTKILAALLVVLAIGLAVLAWLLGRQPERPVAPVTPPVSAAPAPAAEPQPLHAVVVAARPIAAGQRLTAEDVKLAQLPAAVANSFDAVDRVLGRTTVMALGADAPLFEQHLINGLALQLEPGQRALSVAVREQMAAGHHVRPGDFVDVFFTLDGRNDQAAVDSQTRLLLARSRVLAYGAVSVENPPPTASQQRQAQAQEAETPALRRSSSGSGSGNNGGASPSGRIDNAQTAVLAVPLEDVDRLTLAEKYGQLTLALRHPDDSSVPDPSLFAALPTVLQPVAGKLRKGEALQAVDRSFAGLSFKNLATGADARNARRAAPATPLTAVAPAAPRAPRPQTVEVYQGATAQTVHY